MTGGVSVPCTAVVFRRKTLAPSPHVRDGGWRGIDRCIGVYGELYGRAVEAVDVCVRCSVLYASRKGTLAVASARCSDSFLQTVQFPFFPSSQTNGSSQLQPTSGGLIQYAKNLSITSISTLPRVTSCSVVYHGVY